MEECFIAIVGSIKGIYIRFEYHKPYQTSLEGLLRDEPLHGAALSVALIMWNSFDICIQHVRYPLL